MNEITDLGYWLYQFDLLCTLISYPLFQLGKMIPLIHAMVISQTGLALTFVVFLVISTTSPDEKAAVWVLVGFFGLWMAPVFPTGFAWMQEDLIRVTGTVSVIS